MASTSRTQTTARGTHYVPETQALYVTDPRDARLLARLLAWDVVAPAGHETASYLLRGADGVYLLSGHAALVATPVTVLSRALAQTWFNTYGVQIATQVTAFPPALLAEGV